MDTRALTRPTAMPSVFEDFFKPWTQWFDDSRFPGRTALLPAVNIKESGNEYTLSLAAPGLQKEDFSIDVEGNMLTIGSEKETRSEEKDEKFTRKEYNYSSFSRSFTLPDDVQMENIDARYNNGELHVILPRKKNEKQAETNKRIAVK